MSYKVYKHCLCFATLNSYSFEWSLAWCTCDVSQTDFIGPKQAQTVMFLFKSYLLINDVIALFISDSQLFIKMIFF